MFQGLGPSAPISIRVCRSDPAVGSLGVMMVGVWPSILQFGQGKSRPFSELPWIPEAHQSVEVTPIW